MAVKKVKEVVNVVLVVSLYLAD